MPDLCRRTTSQKRDRTPFLTIDSAAASAASAWSTAESNAWAAYQIAVGAAETAWTTAEEAAWSNYESAVTAADNNWIADEETAWNAYESFCGGAGEPVMGAQIILAGWFSAKGGTKATPVPPPAKIGRGFPTTLPPAGQLSVVVAKNGTHTFLILVDSTGKITYFRGGPTSSSGGNLKVEMGTYGTGAEPYSENTSYRWLGNTSSSKLNDLEALMNSLNKKSLSYGIAANNCNSTTCLGIKETGKKIPDTPVPNSRSNSPGWNSNP